MLFLFSWLLLAQATLISPVGFLSPIPDSEIIINQQTHEEILAQESLDLTKRWPQAMVSKGFSNNILLSLHYLNGVDGIPQKSHKIQNSSDIDWEKVNQDFEASFGLEPGQVFAFHKNVLPKYKEVNDQSAQTSNSKSDSKSNSNSQKVITMDSEFVTNEGYKAVAGLGGNGVCHLASLMNWVASEGGLKVEAPTPHDFAPIAGVPKPYLTSIRYQKVGGNSQNENLYIINNLDYPVKFVFEKKGETLELKLIKD